jgi:hypothetical protein
MTRAALVACLVLAGCGGGGLNLNPFARDEPRGIQLETDAAGLAIIGSGGQRIDFGRAPSGVIAALERELGPGRRLALTDCPRAVVQQIAWGDLVLTFTDEQFVGWRGIAGAAGQTCGTMA